MSVLIKGMEMPENCTRCDYIGLNVAIGCPVMSGTNGRATDCPLVALPDKHGRLVDADALGKAVAGMVPYAIDDASSSAYTDGIGAAYYLIGDAPTIVEAEGENEVR